MAETVEILLIGGSGSHDRALERALAERDGMRFSLRSAASVEAGLSELAAASYDVCELARQLRPQRPECAS